MGRQYWASKSIGHQRQYWASESIGHQRQYWASKSIGHQRQYWASETVLGIRDSIEHQRQYWASETVLGIRGSIGHQRQYWASKTVLGCSISTIFVILIHPFIDQTCRKLPKSFVSVILRLSDEKPSPDMSKVAFKLITQPLYKYMYTVYLSHFCDIIILTKGVVNNIS